MKNARKKTKTKKGVQSVENKVKNNNQKQTNIKTKFHKKV